MEAPRMSPDLTEEQYAQLLEQFGAFGSETLMARMGITMTKIGYDFAEGQMPVAGNYQPAGLLHGGAHVVLAESLASMHSFARAGGKNVVGVDLNATHVRAIRDGVVYGRAEVIHAGRTIISHEVKMTNADGKLLSIVRITNMILASQSKRPPLG